MKKLQMFLRLLFVSVALIVVYGLMKGTAVIAKISSKNSAMLANGATRGDTPGRSRG